MFVVMVNSKCIHSYGWCKLYLINQSKTFADSSLDEILSIHLSRIQYVTITKSIL